MMNNMETIGMGRLLLTRRINESVYLTDREGNHIAVISVCKIRNLGEVQLMFEANKNLLIRREELLYRERPNSVDYEEDFQE